MINQKSNNKSYKYLNKLKNNCIFLLVATFIFILTTFNKANSNDILKLNKVITKYSNYNFRKPIFFRLDTLKQAKSLALKPLSALDFGIYASYSLRLLSQTNNVDINYFNQLNNGWGFATDLSFFKNTKNGFNISYFLFKTSAEGYYYIPAFLRYNKITDNYKLQFTTFNYIKRGNFEDTDVIVKIIVGGGLVHYKNIGSDAGYFAEISAKGLAVNFGLNFDYKFCSVGIGLKSGVISSFKLVSGGKSITVNENINPSLMYIMTGIKLGN